MLYCSCTLNDVRHNRRDARVCIGTCMTPIGCSMGVHRAFRAYDKLMTIAHRSHEP